MNPYRPPKPPQAAAPVMSATAAAAGQGVVGGVMRQRVSLGLVKDEPPSSPSFLSKSHTHTNKTVYSEQMHMINVDLAVEGAEASGRQFHTPTASGGILYPVCKSIVYPPTSSRHVPCNSSTLNLDWGRMCPSISLRLKEVLVLPDMTRESRLFCRKGRNSIAVFGAATAVAACGSCVALFDCYSNTRSVLQQQAAAVVTCGDSNSLLCISASQAGASGGLVLSVFNMSCEGKFVLGARFQLHACVSASFAVFANHAKWIIVAGNDNTGVGRVWILSNNIHPRVIFCSDGRGGDALGGGAWSDKVDLGDVKLTRLSMASIFPSQLVVWLFETLKPWHMLDQASPPITFHFSNSKALKSLGLVSATAVAPSSSSPSSPDATGLYGLVVLGHTSGALTAIQIKIEAKAKGWKQQQLQQQQQQQWRGSTQASQIEVVAVQKNAHGGGVGILTCGRRFVYSIGSSDFSVAMWDLGHGGGTVLGPVACIVLYPILRMHPPAPTFKARVVAATVGGSGIVVLMISNVGLVQVTPSAFAECIELPFPPPPVLSTAAAAAFNRGDLKLLYPSSSTSSFAASSFSKSSTQSRTAASITSVCIHPPLSSLASKGSNLGVIVSCVGGAARAHGSRGQGSISIMRSSSPILCAHSLASESGSGLLAMASASRVMLCPPPREIIIQIMTRGMRRWSASSSFTIEASVIECRGWGGDPCDVLTLRGEMKALSGSVYNQGDAGTDEIRVLTGFLLSAAALSDIDAIILRWRCGGGSNGGASLLIDSVMLMDTMSSQTITKSCCRSGSSRSSCTLTSPGSGIIISLHDSSDPLILSDADTPSPYSTSSSFLDERTAFPRPPCRIGRYIASPRPLASPTVVRVSGRGLYVAVGYSDGSVFLIHALSNYVLSAVAAGCSPCSRPGTAPSSSSSPSASRIPQRSPLAPAAGRGLGVGTGLGGVLLRGHSCRVVAADFSQGDGTFLRTQSADGELLLWSVGEGGAGIVDGREGRDVTWATHTVTVGWHAQGLSSISHRCSAAAAAPAAAADNSTIFAVCSSSSSGNLFFHHQPSTSQYLSAKIFACPPHPPGHVAVDLAGAGGEGEMACVSSGVDGGVFSWTLDTREGRSSSCIVNTAMSVEVEENGGVAGGFVDILVYCSSGRVFEVASRSTVLVSMTALQQEQPSPASISLPFSLPQTEVPLFVIFTHSSSNSNLLIHTLIISGEQGMMWAGDLHQSQLAESGAVGGLEQDEELSVIRRISCLDRLTVPLRQQQP